MVAAGIGVAYGLTAGTSGTSGGMTHLFYLPIFAAAFVYGWPGGVLAGFAGGLVCGFLVPVDAHTTTQDTRTWFVRLVAFVVAGGIVGVFASSLRARLRQLQQVSAQVVFAFARAIDVMHRHTGEHSGTVSDHAVAIARELGLDRESVERVRWAGLLHDVGKLAVPREVLDKPGQLTPAEWANVQAHVEASIEILAGIDAFRPYLEGIRHHHERFDGSGYPDGLVGDAIPLDARIITVADAFDAMTSKRPYRPALSETEAIAELRRAGTTQFDPLIVEAFARTLRRPTTHQTASTARSRRSLGHAPG